MDRTGTTYVEVPINRDAVLQFILLMLFLQRPKDASAENNPATFSLPPNEELQIQGFPSDIECSATSDFS